MPRRGASASTGFCALLWILLSLFCLRVVGQALVAFAGVDWLPPIEAWQSGLLPYPWLLSSQAAIILVFGKISLDISRGSGFFMAPRPRLGATLVAFGLVYLAAMLARYGFRMTLHPAERWTGGSIPTFFHWVLAGFILAVGMFHYRPRLGPAGARGALGHGPRSRIPAIVAAGALLAGALWVGYTLSGLPAPRT